MRLLAAFAVGWLAGWSHQRMHARAMQAQHDHVLRVMGQLVESLR